VLTWRHRAGQAKIVGVVASVSGAIFMTCYKGPALFQLQSTAAGHAPETLCQLHQHTGRLFSSTKVYNFFLMSALG
jgi:hypothetical protein